MEVIYDNDVPCTQSEVMKRDRVERIVEIYDSGDYVRDQDFRTDTNPQQPVQCKGSESMRIRVYRSVVVCLGLLCILMAATIALLVLINANNHQYHNKNLRDQQLSKETTLTEEEDRRLTNDTNLTVERDQLLTNDTNRTEEIDELILSIINLTSDKHQLKLKMKNLQMYLGKESKLHDGWIHYKSSFYYISSERKTWDESRRYCRERGADLIIINNKEEQVFIQNMFWGSSRWIGLIDSDEEGRWKWVDGSTLTSGFWRSGEPNGRRAENCVISYTSGWYDYPCNRAFKWICEKKALTCFIDLFIQ